MVDVLAPVTRAVVPDRVRTSLVVSQEEWGGASALANWIQSRGGSPLPASHVGLEIATGSATTVLDTSLTSESAGWWREGVFGFALLVTGHRESVSAPYAGRLTLIASDGTTTFGTWEIRLNNTPAVQLRTFELQQYPLAARGGEIKLVVTAQANRAGLYVDVVQVMELPRSKLALDKGDQAVLPASCGASSPIFDVRHLSARGAVDAYLYADARRQGYFHALSREHPVVISVASTFGFTELFPFGIPVQGPIGAPGDTTTTEVLVAFDARFDDAGDAGNQATVRVVTDEGGSSIDTAITGSAWTTYLVRPTVATEDLDSVDGLRSAVFEMLRISARVVVNSDEPQLDIGTIEVFQVNAEGEQDFSASDYYSQIASSSLEGSGTMTRSVMVRVDDGPTACTLFEHEDANGGWALRIDGSGQPEFRLRNGATTYDLKAAALTQGRTYVITASWDGTNQRLVVDQTAATPQAAGFVVGDSTAVLGASAGGASPAADYTILGASASDSVALSDADMQAHNALCAAVADMRAFVGCESLYSARFGLHCDMLAETHWTLSGSTTAVRFAPLVG